MKDTIIQLYYFRELSNDVQEKVLDNSRYDWTEEGIWDEHVLDLWRERLIKRGYVNPVISYTGFGSQGDGASFVSRMETDWFTSNTLFWDMINNVGLDLRIKRNPLQRHRHKYSCHVHATLNTKRNVSEKLTIRLADLRNELEEEYQCLCEDIYDSLEEEYDWLTSDKYVRERLEENEDTETYLVSGAIHV